MKTTLLICTVLFFLILVSCNNTHKDNSMEILDTKISSVENIPSPQTSKKDKQKIPVSNFQVPDNDTASSPTQAKTTFNFDWNKKIIKTATLKLEVKDFKNYSDNIHQTIKQFGGYIAQEEQNSTDEKSETVMVIKVPADQFEIMMNQISGSDNKILERKITSEDVTGEVVDTRLRLEAKKGMRLKYLEFLKQSKNMEVSLQVQNEINNIREEIESAAGRVAFLSHQSSYSTINCTFYRPINGYKPTDGHPSFLTRINTAFTTGTKWLADLFVGIISIWPLLITGIVIYIGWKEFTPAKILPQNS